MSFPPLSLHIESGNNSSMYLQHCSVPLPASILVSLALPSSCHQALYTRGELPWIILSLTYVQSSLKLHCFQGFLFSSSNNQSIFYFPSWGLETHPCKRYWSFAEASLPLPSKHIVMLISSFQHLTPSVCTPAPSSISHQISPPCCHWHQLYCLLFSFLWCLNVLTNTGLYTNTPCPPGLSTSYPYSAPLCREFPQNQPPSNGWSSCQPDKAICSIFITIAFKA